MDPGNGSRMKYPYIHVKCASRIPSVFEKVFEII